MLINVRIFLLPMGCGGKGLVSRYSVNPARLLYAYVDGAFAEISSNTS